MASPMPDGEFDLTEAETDELLFGLLHPSQQEAVMRHCAREFGRWFLTLGDSWTRFSASIIEQKLNPDNANSPKLKGYWNQADWANTPKGEQRRKSDNV